MALDVVYGLVDVFLMTQITTVSQGEYLKVFFMYFSLLLFIQAPQVGYFGIDNDSHVLDLVTDLKVSASLGDGLEGDFVWVLRVVFAGFWLSGWSHIDSGLFGSGLDGLGRNQEI